MSNFIIDHDQLESLITARRKNYDQKQITVPFKLGVYDTPNTISLIEKGEAHTDLSSDEFRSVTGYFNPFHNSINQDVIISNVKLIPNTQGTDTLLVYFEVVQDDLIFGLSYKFYAKTGGVVFCKNNKKNQLNLPFAFVSSLRSPQGTELNSTGYPVWTRENQKLYEYGECFLNLIEEYIRTNFGVTNLFQLLLAPDCIQKLEQMKDATWLESLE